MFVYDPHLVGAGKVLHYNGNAELPFFKKKRPEIVKWVEPFGRSTASQFLVAFEDGVIYLYEKETMHDPKEDYTKTVIPIEGEKPKKKDEKELTKADLIMEMQKKVEDFDFEQLYKADDPVEDKKKLHFEEAKSVHSGLIHYTHRIFDYSHRHYNHAIAHYTPGDKLINPKLIMRFQCRGITCI